MQKWEYAYREKREEWSLTYLHPDGPNIETFKGKFLKGTPWSQYLVQRDAWITKLGQEGYEMIGFAGSDTYWFKCPFPV